MSKRSFRWFNIQMLKKYTACVRVCRILVLYSYMHRCISSVYDAIDVNFIGESKQASSSRAELGLLRMFKCV